jgi:hypothetical protein
MYNRKLKTERSNNNENKKIVKREKKRYKGLSLPHNKNKMTLITKHTMPGLLFSFQSPLKSLMGF